MLRSITERWARDGHDVEVFSAQPSYKAQVKIDRRPPVERENGVRIRRIALPANEGCGRFSRLFNVIAFPIAVFIYILARPRFDVIMASTAPPVLVGAATRLAARLRGAKFVYHCMDLHPEIGRISGEFRNPVLYSLLQRIDTGSCLSAARVIVLSSDMKRSLLQRPAGGKARVEMISNFNLAESEEQNETRVPHGMEKQAGRFRILFAGNIGRFQGLETIVDAACLLRHKSNLELVFLGDGKSVDELREYARDVTDAAVRFFPHQPTDVARAVIRTADLCLVSLRPGIYKYAYPSKTMTYLCEGRPLLVCVEPASELAGFVEAYGVGTAVEPGDPVALAEQIEVLMGNPDKLQSMAEKAAIIGRRLYGRELVLERWSQLLREIEEDR